MKLNKLIFIYFLITNVTAYCQLQIDWQQCYGGSEYEYAQDIVKTENGYLIMGSTKSTDGEVSNNYGGYDYWIIQVDTLDNVLWDKNFGGSLSDFLYNGFYAANSTDIYLVGNSSSVDGDISYDPYGGEANLWVVRIDHNGNILWDRKVGSPIGLAYDQFGKATTDGGVILSAQVDRLGGDVSVYYGGYDGWIIKLDSDGHTDWDFSIGTSAFEFINHVRQTNDGGYIAALSGQPNGIDGNIDCQCIEGSPDAIAYKLDAYGKGIWNKCYGGSGFDGIFDILETETGFMFIGFTTSSDGDLQQAGYHGKDDVWVIKTDSLGNLIWNKCYGGSENDFPTAIFKTSGGDFVVFANTHSFDGDVIDNPSNSTAHSSIWVFKINSIGELLWQQCIGSHADEQVYGVNQHEDYEYSIAGLMTYSPSGDVNCSNFVYGSQGNYWAFGLTDVTVNIAESSVSDNITVFPNPAKSILTIVLPKNFMNGNTTIRLIDATGMQILKLEPQSANSQLNISGLSKGLYTVLIQNNGKLYVKKIIIQ